MMVGHVQRRSADATVRKNDSLEVMGTPMGRGGPKKTWIQIVRNDLKALNLID